MHAAISEAIIGSAFEILNVLGAGFLEKVYERAMRHELSIRGLSVHSQKSFSISYKGQCVGEYFADLIVAGKVVVELKCVDHLASEHVA